MKLLFKLIPVLLITLFITSCDPIEEEKAIESFLIAQGNLYGAGGEGIQEENLYIKSEGTWNSLLEKINSVNNESDKFTETDIDFDEYHIIAVFDQNRPTSGYSVVLDITEDDDNVFAEVTKTTPEGIMPTVITQPFTIVKITATNKTVLFQ